jgi:hypothetical protein
MTVEQPKVIDFVSTSKERTRVYLTISDHLDWSEDDEEHHLLSLQEKIQNYLHFVESGQLAKYRSEFKGLPVTIRVKAKYPLQGEGVKFYEAVHKIVADAGLTLEFEHAPSEQREGGR